jgi:CTP:molybdopterin cytidylyltransferase MocA
MTGARGEPVAAPRALRRATPEAHGPRNAQRLRRRLNYRLHCIIDTAGKSLHAWFDAPRNKMLENRLKTALVVFGCDPKLFTYSQPVRVPGAFRDGRLQRLVWLRDEG